MDPNEPKNSGAMMADEIDEMYGGFLEEVEEEQENEEQEE